MGLSALPMTVLGKRGARRLRSGTQGWLCYRAVHRLGCFIYRYCELLLFTPGRLRFLTVAKPNWRA